MGSLLRSGRTQGLSSSEEGQLAQRLSLSPCTLTSMTFFNLAGGPQVIPCDSCSPKAAHSSLVPVWWNCHRWVWNSPWDAHLVQVSVLNAKPDPWDYLSVGSFEKTNEWLPVSLLKSSPPHISPALVLLFLLKVIYTYFISYIVLYVDILENDFYWITWIYWRLTDNSY